MWFVQRFASLVLASSASSDASVSVEYVVGVQNKRGHLGKLTELNFRSFLCFRNGALEIYKLKYLTTIVAIEFLPFDLSFVLKRDASTWTWNTNMQE